MSRLASMMIVLFAVSACGRTPGPDHNIMLMKTVGVTIASSASVSEEIDLEDYCLVGLVIPSAWTAADIGFTASATTGGTFVNVVDGTGSKISTRVSASTAVDLVSDGEQICGLRFIKLLSCTAVTCASPVNQVAARAVSAIFAR